MTEATVTELTTYPVKGCKGISLQVAITSPTGFLFDRMWMLVEAETGQFITQRTDPVLAQVSTALPPEALAGWGSGDLPPEAALCLSAPDLPEPLCVPLAPPLRSTTLVDASVWEWQGQAADEGDDAAEWCSRLIGRPTRLVRHAGWEEGGEGGAPQRGFMQSLGLGKPPATKRPTDKAYAQNYHTGFSDGFPYHLTTTASLQALNERLAMAVPMNRFRANIVVDHAGAMEGQEEAWREDSWVDLQIGDGSVRFRSVKPCSRCLVTTINQSTGEKDRQVEPLKTLQTFRTGRQLGFGRPDLQAGIFFGWNLVCGELGAEVKVGDKIRVCAERTPGASL